MVRHAADRRKQGEKKKKVPPFDERRLPLQRDRDKGAAVVDGVLTAAGGKDLVVDLDKQTRLKMIPHVVQVQVRRDTLMLGFGVWHVACLTRGNFRGGLADPGKKRKLGRLGYLHT